AIENGKLLFLIWIGELQLEHEAIDLRFRKRIGALLFDRVLSSKHEEWHLESIARLANGHLFFLHRLEQRALHLGGGAVDLVGQDQIGKDGALSDRKFTG